MSSEYQQIDALGLILAKCASVFSVRSTVALFSFWVVLFTIRAHAAFLLVDSNPCVRSYDYNGAVHSVPWTERWNYSIR
jgi:hypothetical protein